MNAITIHYPTEEIKLLPIARPQLRHLRGLIVELQSYWVEYVFSVADVMADDHCWKLMGQIANLLPRATNAAVRGFDLEALSNDYEQIEALFLCQGKEVSSEEVHGYSLARFRMDRFAPCKLLYLHKFNHEVILEEAEAMRKERLRLRLEQFTAEMDAEEEADPLETPEPPSPEKSLLSVG